MKEKSMVPDSKMSKEASIEKASQVYWDRNQINAEDQAGNKIEYFDGDRAIYSQLVSLEAKIELLKYIIAVCNPSDDVYNKQFLSELESEYQKLIEQHKL